jgi:predicted DsbA family dithiol-disulfide isomerase
MRVEIWSDLICPWCGLGNHRLQLALDRFEHRSDIELINRSFQLDETTPPDRTQPVREMLTDKYGWSPAQVEATTKRVEDLAEADGLKPYHVLENRTGNTVLAHQFAAWAAEKGQGDAAWKLLYKKYFGEQQSIFDLDSLARLAPELGLDADEALAAIVSKSYEPQVRAEQREARSMGATGVPFFVIDRRYAVSGAQPVEVLLKALEAAWSEKD